VQTMSAMRVLMSARSKSISGAHVKSRNIVWRQDARIESESGERRLGDPGKLFLRLLLQRVLGMTDGS